MNILHYSLGISPYRTGGLTKYSTDLAQGQADAGDFVAIMWPGRYKKKNKIVTTKKNKVISLELCQTALVPLTFGTRDPLNLINDFNEDLLCFIFDKYNFERVYIHTLQGIPSKLIEICKKRNILTYFITHDYFGMCLKCSGFYDGNNCNFNDYSTCGQCLVHSLSTKKILIMQKRFYRFFKNFFLVKMARKFLRKLLVKQPEKKNDLSVSETDIEKVQLYFRSLLEQVDVILCNSAVSKERFYYFGQFQNMKIIPITHKNISDNRRLREYIHLIKIGYIGPENHSKGFFELIHQIDKNLDTTNIHLVVYGPDNFIKRDYITYMGKYKYDDFEKVFNSFDMLVVPSVWQETFGFITLEAISYGVPVLCTNNVGSKHLVSESFVCKTEELWQKIDYYMHHPEGLSNENERIVTADYNIFFDFKQYISFMKGE